MHCHAAMKMFKGKRYKGNMASANCAVVVFLLPSASCVSSPQSFFSNRLSSFNNCFTHGIDRFTKDVIMSLPRVVAMSLQGTAQGVCMEAACGQRREESTPEERTAHRPTLARRKRAGPHRVVPPARTPAAR